MGKAPSNAGQMDVQMIVRDAGSITPADRQQFLPGDDLTVPFGEIPEQHVLHRRNDRLDAVDPDPGRGAVDPQATEVDGQRLEMERVVPDARIEQPEYRLSGKRATDHSRRA